MDKIQDKAVEQAIKLLESRGMTIAPNKKRTTGWIGRKGTSVYIAGIGQKFLKRLKPNELQILADAKLSPFIIEYLTNVGVKLPELTAAPAPAPAPVPTPEVTL